MQDASQQAYDRGVTVFSPDGRLYQVEYAREAVKRGSATVGVRTSESVVFASMRRPRSPLMEADSVEKIHDLDGRLGVASAGHVADARRLVDVGRQFAQRERLRYGEPATVETVAKAVADFVQETTQTGGTRPFGTALLFGGVDETGPALYEIDPSGTPAAWQATAIGNRSGEMRGYFEDTFAPGFDTDAGVELALQGLDDGVDEELTPDSIALATLDDSGFDALDRDERETALEDAGVAAS